MKSQDAMYSMDDEVDDCLIVKKSQFKEVTERLCHILEGSVSSFMTTGDIEKAYENEYNQKLSMEWRKMFHHYQRFRICIIDKSSRRHPEKLLLFKPSFIDRISTRIINGIVTENDLRNRIQMIIGFAKPSTIKLSNIERIHNVLYNSNLCELVMDTSGCSLEDFYNKYFASPDIPIKEIKDQDVKEAFSPTKVTRTNPETKIYGSLALEIEEKRISKLLTHYPNRIRNVISIKELVTKYKAAYNMSLFQNVKASIHDLYPWSPLLSMKGFITFTISGYEKQMEYTFIWKSIEYDKIPPQVYLHDRLRRIFYLFYPLAIGYEQIATFYELIFGESLAAHVLSFSSLSWKDSITKGTWDSFMEWTNYPNEGLVCELNVPVAQKVDEIIECLTPILEKTDKEYMTVNEIEIAYEQIYKENMVKCWLNFLDGKQFRICTIPETKEYPENTLIFKPSYIKELKKRAKRDRTVTEDILCNRIKTIIDYARPNPIEILGIANFYKSLFKEDLPTVIKEHTTYTLDTFYDTFFLRQEMLPSQTLPSQNISQPILPQTEIADIKVANPCTNFVVLTNDERNKITALFPVLPNNRLSIISVKDLINNYKIMYKHSLIDILKPFYRKPDTHPWCPLLRVEGINTFILPGCEKNTKHIFVWDANQPTLPSTIISMPLVRERIQDILSFFYPIPVEHAVIDRFYQLHYHESLSSQIQSLTSNDWKTTIERGVWNSNVSWNKEPNDVINCIYRLTEGKLNYLRTEIEAILEEDAKVNYLTKGQIEETYWKKYQDRLPCCWLTICWETRSFRFCIIEYTNPAYIEETLVLKPTFLKQFRQDHLVENVVEENLRRRVGSIIELLPSNSVSILKNIDAFAYCCFSESLHKQIKSITSFDLKGFYDHYFAPSITTQPTIAQHKSTENALKRITLSEEEMERLIGCFPSHKKPVYNVLTMQQLIDQYSATYHISFLSILNPFLIAQDKYSWSPLLRMQGLNTFIIPGMTKINTENILIALPAVVRCTSKDKEKNKDDSSLNILLQQLRSILLLLYPVFIEHVFIERLYEMVYGSVFVQQWQACGQQSTWTSSLEQGLFNTFLFLEWSKASNGTIRCRFKYDPAVCPVSKKEKTLMKIFVEENEITEVESNRERSRSALNNEEDETISNMQIEVDSVVITEKQSKKKKKQKQREHNERIEELRSSSSIIEEPSSSAKKRSKHKKNKKRKAADQENDEDEATTISSITESTDIQKHDHRPSKKRKMEDEAMKDEDDWNIFEIQEIKSFPICIKEEKTEVGITPKVKQEPVYSSDEPLHVKQEPFLQVKNEFQQEQKEGNDEEEILFAHAKPAVAIQCSTTSLTKATRKSFL